MDLVSALCVCVLWSGVCAIEIVKWYFCNYKTCKIEYMCMLLIAVIYASMNDGMKNVRIQ